MPSSDLPAGLPYFSWSEIARYAKSGLAPGSEVISDGLWCFKGVTEAACTHSAIVTGGGRKSAQLSCFKWVNTMLGNVKIVCWVLFMLFE
jgi:hypothetical protein